MNYLTLENVSKSYGDKILFENLSFSINKGQKVAFIARNGTGKSTLLKVIVGLDSSDGDTAVVRIHKEAKMGYLDQAPDFAPHLTVMEAIFESENPMIQAVKRYEEALLYPEKEKELEEALALMDEYKAWDFEVKIKQILSKLKVNNIQQQLGTMSGGQQKRVALAKVLIDEPDFIILDEPTNHLDLEMVEWLENYLEQVNLTIFMVTHDRYFLDRVCNTIIELEGGKIYKYKGNYSYYLEQKSIRTEIKIRSVERSRRLMVDELEWVRRMPKARGTKAKARMDAFVELKKKASQKIHDPTFAFNIKQTRLGKKIVELYNINKAFGNFKLVENFSYKFAKGERVGIVGENGTGKSTFLKMLTEELRPDSGKVQIGVTVEFGHYKQDGISLKDNQTMIEVINEISPYIELGNGAKMYAEQFLERFLFPKSQHRLLVEKLSGGEKRRLYLLTVLLKNPNFLILDEPTNDLDILTLNVLEQFLMEFQGCLIVVSHDRYFLDKIVDHLFVFQGDGKIKDYNGTYTEYKIYKKEQELAAKRLERAEQEQQKIAAPSKPKQQEKRKLSYKEQKEFEQLETDIEALEERKEEITAAFGDTSLSGDQIMELSKEMSQLETDLATKESRWEELAEYL